MWITFCQEARGFFLLCMVFFAILLLVMEKMIKMKKLKRKRKHGFLSRMATHNGQKVIKRRRSKQRKRIAV